jgi:hypothetical protein
MFELLLTISGLLAYLEHDAISGNIEKVRASAQRIWGAAKFQVENQMRG